MDKKYTEEQIIAVLMDGEAGTKVADLCPKHGMNDASFSIALLVTSILPSNGKTLTAVGL
jgi:hypothetical protein